MDRRSVTDLHVVDTALNDVPGAGAVGALHAQLNVTTRDRCRSSRPGSDRPRVASRDDRRPSSAVDAILDVEEIARSIVAGVALAMEVVERQSRGRRYRDRTLCENAVSAIDVGVARGGVAREASPRVLAADS